MQPGLGGQLGPPKPSPITQIEPGETRSSSTSNNVVTSSILPSQITRHLYFEEPIISPESYIPSHSQYQIPPATRAYQPSRSYQRIYRGYQRQRPYSMSGERVYRRASHSVLQEDESMQMRVPTRNTESGSYEEVTKRGVTCRCTACDEPIQLYDRYEDSLLETASEETQRISTRWMQDNGSQPLWQIEGTSNLTRDSVARSRRLSDSRYENRLSRTPPSSTDASIFSESFAHGNSVLTSIIPDSNVPNGETECLVSSQHISSRRDSSGYSIRDMSLKSPDKTDAELFNPPLDEICAENDPHEALIISNRLFALSMTTRPELSAHARHVANRVIKHARGNKTPEESAMWCPDCGLFPDLPITGQCGHTRCTKCIQAHGACPCGIPAPKDLYVNTLIQDLIAKMLPNELYRRMALKTSGSVRKVKLRENLSKSSALGQNSAKARFVMFEGARKRRLHSSHVSAARPSSARGTDTYNIPMRAPMSPKKRFEHGRKLLGAGQYREAAPQLARVAASAGPLARAARTLLAHTITLLSQGRDPRRLTRELYRSVRLQAAAAWLKPADLECVLCYHPYTRPVTTPCGHTYCRTCIERSMDYKKACALCLRPLDDFDLAETRETVFISAALSSIDALSPPPPPDPNVIPIFVCTVAYPAMPCPLFIFDPRYWLMIRRVLESGSRKFGMVAYERDRAYSDYGTVLEVCDCVHLEDGRSILSTVGVSRFRVIDRDVRDGCDIARIQPLTDTIPAEGHVIMDLRMMATKIKYKAMLWLNGMNRALLSEIEAAFGQLPHFELGDARWWENADGPAWLWWLIAILPLRSEIKVLILATKSLLKRMMAVSRTLEAIDRIDTAAHAAPDCELRTALNNTEAWLERST